MTTVARIDRCRGCGNAHLVPVIDLGIQFLTGRFSPRGVGVTEQSPLELVRCSGESTCGLVQLAHTFPLDQMYGDNYGYRSGLNPSMITHLASLVQRSVSMRPVGAGDVVLDIGSNDGTTLRQFPQQVLKVGIDPTANKFAAHYPSDAIIVADFFSAASYREVVPHERAAIISSHSMFYDLNDPLTFMCEVASILKDDGIWLMEQSYLPSMLQANSFDTICHEHLEYYSLSNISWLAERAGLRVIDVTLTATNGGSFLVVLGHSSGPHATSLAVREIMNQEGSLGLDTDAPFLQFRERVEAFRDSFNSFLLSEKARGKRFAGLGASTKGNVLLQYCGITESEIEVIGDVNPDKFGAETPGSRIPIEDEKSVLAADYDYYVVLPWHFKEFFLTREDLQDKALVFPLPSLFVSSPRKRSEK